jgi:hypothetical protein
MGHIGAGAFADNLGGLPAAARYQVRNVVAGQKEYQPFIDILYLDLSDLINHLQANPQRRHHLSEDSLTEEIITGLSVAGYNASHDRSSGGHVDITIQLGPHTWIGEAKKDKKFSDGYRQLIARYRPASGDFEHNQGGMILYHTQRTDLLTRRSNWVKQFKKDFSEIYSPVHVEDCPKSRFAFITRHKHPVSGLDYTVRHMMVGLQFFPTDASARISEKKSLTKSLGDKPLAKRKSSS